MKYMLIMRATDDSAYAGFADVDMDQMLETMGRFNEELISAGVLLAAEGLDDASTGVVVDHGSTPPVVTDGPDGETKRMPSFGAGFQTQIRRVPTIDEFPQDNPWIQKERAWRESTGQL